ncbi:hypothetical protein DFH07DRAFT_942295 [Mycena maculata]|uniref:Uncharacterized protein n=1 Tax=Mycena maculata TaxID=230809 RepID=A0AAD7ISA7_9AGAR|nr:hypothetical protein DFH07DRAFT_942295 [Mycena maculata]
MTSHTPNLVPTIPSGALPSTPATEWAASTTRDVLGTPVIRTPPDTPGPSLPGAYPHPEEAVGNNNGEGPIQAAKYALKGMVGYFGISQSAHTLTSTSTESPTAEQELPLDAVTSPEDLPIGLAAEPAAPRAGTNLSTAVHTGHSVSQIPALDERYLALDARIQRPEFARHPTSSSLTSLATTASSFSATSGLSTATNHPREGYTNNPNPHDAGYAPLVSTPALVSPVSVTVAEQDKIIHPRENAGASPFTPIPPVREVDDPGAYFPAPHSHAFMLGVQERSMGEDAAEGSAADERARLVREGGLPLVRSVREYGLGSFDSSSISSLMDTGNGKGASADGMHASGQTDVEDAQRAVFSEPGFGMLGCEEDGIEVDPREAATDANSRAQQGGAMFTTYAVHAPHASGQGENSVEDGASPVEDGEDTNGNGKATKRRSRFVAKIKEKMHVG